MRTGIPLALTFILLPALSAAGRTPAAGARSTAVKAGHPAPASLGRGGILIDGIAAVVNRTPITLSQVEDAGWYARFSASLQGIEDLKPLSRQESRQALQHLIDEELLLEAQRKTGYDPVSAASVRQQLARIARLAGGAAALRKKLHRYHLRSTDLEAMVGRQLDILNFLDQRLRPSVSVPDHEVEQYYRTKFVPAALAHGLRPAAMDKVRDRIRTILFQRELEQRQQQWLRQLRASAQIERPAHGLRPLG